MSIAWDYLEEDTVVLYGFDDAIVGVGFSWDAHQEVLIYSYDKMLEILQLEHGMSAEEADEYIQYNIVRAYVGVGTPIIMRTDIFI